MDMVRDLSLCESLVQACSSSASPKRVCSEVHVSVTWRGSKRFLRLSGASFGDAAIAVVISRLQHAVGISYVVDPTTACKLQVLNCTLEKSTKRRL